MQVTSRDTINWKFGFLNELDAETVFRLFQLRQDVFILEQQCLYPDIDSSDAFSVHLIAHDEHTNLVACLRIIPPESKQHDVTIGRVVVTQTARGTGLGRQLILKGIDICTQQYSQHNIHVSAQSHLVALYASTGFVVQGKEYMEDGIPHKAMRLMVTD